MPDPARGAAPCERCGPNSGVTWAGPVLLWSQSVKVCCSPFGCGGCINRGWHAPGPAQVLSSSWGKSQKPELQKRLDCTSSCDKTPFLNCNLLPHLAQIHVLGAMLWPLVAACAGRASSDPSGHSAGLSLPGSEALGQLLCPLYSGQAAEGLGRAQSSKGGLGAPLATRCSAQSPSQPLCPWGTEPAAASCGTWVSPAPGHSEVSRGWCRRRGSAWPCRHLCPVSPGAGGGMASVHCLREGAQLKRKALP